MNAATGLVASTGPGTRLNRPYEGFVIVRRPDLGTRMSLPSAVSPEKDAEPTVQELGGEPILVERWKFASVRAVYEIIVASARMKLLASDSS